MSHQVAFSKNPNKSPRMLNFSSSIAAPGQNFHATTDGSKFFAPQQGISLLPIGYQCPPPFRLRAMRLAMPGSGNSALTKKLGSNDALSAF
jgi:hypothetical protein